MSLAYRSDDLGLLTFTEVREAADRDRAAHSATLRQRQRTRAILNGGAAGIRALVGDEIDLGGEVDMPAANLMFSGLERLAQKLGQPPTIKVDPPEDRESDRAKRRASKTERIVETYDEVGRLELQLPQMGRWLPGYGFGVWLVREKEISRARYPVAQLRDPYFCYPGWWGPDQQPSSLTVARQVPGHVLRRLYPRHSSKFPDDGPGFSQGWEGFAGNYTIVDYYDTTGSYCYCEAPEVLLEAVPNPLGIPRFVVPHRAVFDLLVGQFEHVVGIMSMMAKLNVLAAAAMEDAVNVEALALDTPIPTPTGWTTMGRIVEGDLILGSDGLPVEVVAATDVQTDRECYRVTFEDSTSVVASDGHLWRARRIGGTNGNSYPEKIYTTRQMAESPHRFRVPAAAPWKLPEADLPIDPYVLGLWLGDGNSKNAVITAGHSDIAEVESLIRQTGHLTRRVSVEVTKAPQIYVSLPGSRKGLHGSGLHGQLRQAGLFGNKHIPDVYLRASFDQRLALLQGLMDSDGTISQQGQCTFANTDRRLADGATELLRSLGEVPVATWTADDRARSGGCWLVTFTPRHVVPFRMARKAARVHMHRRGPRWVTIRSIEAVDTVPVRCVAVASADHLFLAGAGAHTTHNTNVFGQIRSNRYQKGRFAVNEFEPSARVEKPTNNLPYQLFEHIDRLERQLRLTGGYPITDDAESPNSFVTGRGLEELGAGASRIVGEYQTILRWSLQDLDSLRLSWDEEYYSDQRKPLFGVRGGVPFTENYTPAADISGQHRTRRVYGMMAGWDEPTKIVTGIQLLNNGVIDVETFQENLRGLSNLPRINQRIRRKAVEGALVNGLGARFGQGDPRAALTLIDMYRDIAGFEEALVRYNTPDEPQMTPEEEAMLQPQLPEVPGQPRPVSTVLSRLEQSGAVGGGSQVVNVRRG